MFCLRKRSQWGWNSIIKCILIFGRILLKFWYLKMSGPRSLSPGRSNQETSSVRSFWLSFPLRHDSFGGIPESQNSPVYVITVQVLIKYDCYWKRLARLMWLEILPGSSTSHLAEAGRQSSNWWAVMKTSHQSPLDSWQSPNLVITWSSHTENSQRENQEKWSDQSLQVISTSKKSVILQPFHVEYKHINIL